MKESNYFKEFSFLAYVFVHVYMHIPVSMSMNMCGGVHTEARRGVRPHREEIGLFQTCPAFVSSGIQTAWNPKFMFEQTSTLRH